MRDTSNIAVLSASREIGSTPTIPLSVRVCLLYNRCFQFRRRWDSLIKQRTEAECERKENPRAADLRYAESEYLKARSFLQKFGGVSLVGRRVLDFGCRFGGSSVWYSLQ